LNSILHAGKAGTVPLETHLQWHRECIASSYKGTNPIMRALTS
jgi:hypothetical protein